MQRRDLLKAFPALAATALLPTAVLAQVQGALKVTNIEVKRTKVVRELGTISQRSGRPERPVTVGGETVTIISTDGGIKGYAEGVSPQMLRKAKEYLIGKDPLLISNHAYELFDPDGGGANIEIALWDIIGKATNLPLWKLWGGAHNVLMPYASQHSVQPPAQKAKMAQMVHNNGWQAIKYRVHYQTMKEDVALIEETRKLMGNDFAILTDINQAGNAPDGWGGGTVRWDLRRAMETAKEFERLNVFWMEEPLPRWAFDELATLTASTEMLIAGGEGQHALHEYRWMVEKKVFDVLQFEVGIIGPTVARQVANLALANDLYAIGHVGGGLTQLCSGHLSASFTNSPKLTNDYPNNPTWEIFYEPPVEDPFAHWEVFTNPPVMDKSKGTIRLPDAPGLGVTIKPDLLIDA